MCGNSWGITLNAVVLVKSTMLGYVIYVIRLLRDAYDVHNVTLWI